jgi:hypothetical protein
VDRRTGQQHHCQSLERLRAVLNDGYEEILVGASGQVRGMGAPVTSAS